MSFTKLMKYVLLCSVFLILLTGIVDATELIITQIVKTEGTEIPPAFPNVAAYFRIYDNGCASNVDLDGFTVEVDHPITGNVILPPGTFTIQEVTDLDTLYVVLVMDRSGSMGWCWDGYSWQGCTWCNDNPAIHGPCRMTVAKDAANSFVSNLTGTDHGAILSFSSGSTIDQGWTTDNTLLSTAVNGINAGGGTAMYDAVINSLNWLMDSVDGRKAVICLTDGCDTQSNNSLADAITTATGAAVPVYTIGMGTGASYNPSDLEELAIDTGGDFYEATNPDSLTAIYQKIAESLRCQFLLNYTDPNPTEDGTERTLLISTTHEGEYVEDTGTYEAPYTPKPDLTITNISTIPASGSIISGDLIDITALVSNIGDVNATNTVVSFYLGDPEAGGILLGTSASFDLNSGVSNWVEITNVSTAGYNGTYAIYAWVDPADNINEHIETNNTYNINIDIQSITIEGRVYELNTTNRINGATVTLEINNPANTNYPKTDITGVSGLYQFVDNGAATYRLSASAPHYAPYTGGWIYIDDATGTIDIYLERLYTLSGTVADVYSGIPLDSPLPAEVYLYSGGNTVRHVQSDILTGVFTFEDVPDANDYTIDASNPNYFTSNVYGPYDTTPPKDISGINIELYKRIVISGNCTNSMTSALINGVTITITSSNTPPNSVTATSNASGDYIASAVRAGDITIVATCSGYMPQTINLTNLNTTPYTVDFALIPAIYFEGVVTDTDGNPIDNATIVIEQNGSTVNTATTNVTGNYMSNYLPGGTGYRIYCSKEGYYPQSRDFSATSIQSPRTGEDFTLVSIALSGIVVDACDLECAPNFFPPIANATVTATNIANADVYTATTNALGRYEISPLPTATYNVVVTKTGFWASTIQTVSVAKNKMEESTILVPNGNSCDNCDLVEWTRKSATADFLLTREMVFNGNVTESATGNPIEGAWINIYDVNDVILLDSVETNTSGYYNFEWTNPGDPLNSTTPIKIGAKKLGFLPFVSDTFSCVDDDIYNIIMTPSTKLTFDPVLVPIINPPDTSDSYTCDTIVRVKISGATLLLGSHLFISFDKDFAEFIDAGFLVDDIDDSTDFFTSNGAVGDIITNIYDSSGTHNILEVLIERQDDPTTGISIVGEKTFFTLVFQADGNISGTSPLEFITDYNPGTGVADFCMWTPNGDINNPDLGFIAEDAGFAAINTLLGDFGRYGIGGYGNLDRKLDGYDREIFLDSYHKHYPASIDTMLANIAGDISHIDEDGNPPWSPYGTGEANDYPYSPGVLGVDAVVDTMDWMVFDEQYNLHCNDGLVLGKYSEPNYFPTNDNVILSLKNNNQMLKVGDRIYLDLEVKDVTNLGLAFIKVHFDAETIKFINFEPNRSFVEQSGAEIMYCSEIKNNKVEVNYSVFGGSPRGINGTGVIGRFTFDVIGGHNSTSNLRLSAYLRDTKCNKIEAKKENAKLSIETEPQAISTSIPNTFALFQNMPNPFNPDTDIRFNLPTNAKTELRIYNAAGQLVRTLVNENKEAGSYTIRWNGRDNHNKDVTSGVYFYTIKAGTYTATRRMVLLK